MNRRKTNHTNCFGNGWKSVSAELRILSLFLILAGAWTCSREENKGQEFGDRAMVLIFTQSKKTVTVQAEVAQTEEQREQGLMYRKELGENQGMLFIMPYSGNQEFWMKNTLIPLDLIFIGEDLIIKGMVENAIPESTNPLGISEPSRYVLEVNGGYCRKNGIQAGDTVKFIRAGE